MKIYILGLGDTITQYKHNPNNITFGVNDIEAKINASVDYLVCVNTVGCFSNDRAKVIKESTPKRFYTVDYDTREWEQWHNVIKLDKNYVYKMSGEVKETASIDSSIVYAGLSSPFMAIQLAYQLYPEVKEFHIYGVDFINHWAFNGHRLDKELSYWEWLFKQFKSKGITIVLPKESVLNQLI